MIYSEPKFWIWLTIAFGPANSHKWNVVRFYGSAKRTYDALTGGDMSKVLPSDRKRVNSATFDRVNRLMDLCDKNGIKICAYDDSEYPKRLKEIYNPPSVLFYFGDISGLNTHDLITCVGTRKPSEYSVSVGNRLITELVEKDFKIASGFAVGLDSLSHRSAIKAGGNSYAFLPCGLLEDYPKENADAKKVVAAHGAVISEYFPGEKPNPLMFRARNRILSGVSLGTLILQAGEKSGALSTASFALAQGREIFCIPPHDIYDERYLGVTELLRLGATPVFEAFDIISAYNLTKEHTIEEENTESEDKSDKNTETLEKISEKTSYSERKKSVGRTVSASKKNLDVQKRDPDTSESELTGFKAEIYNFIREKGEIHLDEISIGIGDVFEIEAYLTELELDGLIKSLPGNRFRAA